MTRLKKIRNIRKMTWVLVAWCALIIAWIASAVSSASSSVQKCVNEHVLGHHLCSEAVGAGAGIGVMIVLFIGFCGFIFFSLIWFMSRPKAKVAA